MRFKYYSICFWVLLALLVPFTTLSAQADNCFTVIVGKDVSVSGGVIMAHNEDDSEANLFVNVHKIAPGFNDGSRFVKFKNNPSIPQTRNPQGFLWLQIPGIDFADAYVNQKGVTIASNACPSRENKGELVEGGIGYMLRRLVAEQATSARQAVTIAGKLIETYGYYSSGRSYAIADANEGWLLHVVNGKHWIAQRVPDDEVAVIANCYTIGEINLKDSNHFLGSPDIISYAVKRGWYEPQKDSRFHFAHVYSAAGNMTDEKNTIRRWRGVSLLSKKKYKISDDFPFSFVPKDKIDVSDMFGMLRDHYEGTNYDRTNNYKNGSPNSSGIRTICTASTQYSFVANLRNHLPQEIGFCVWIAFRRPDSNGYAPWYPSILEPPSGYSYGQSTTALKFHYSLLDTFGSYQPNYAFWCFAKLSQLVDADYINTIHPVRKEWQNYENYTLKRMDKIEKEFKYQLKANHNIALKIITNFVHKGEYRKWFLASELIDQIGTQP